jgi:hypothetical protein
MIAGLRKRIQQAIKKEEIVINLTCFEDGFTLPEVLELIKPSNRSYFLGKRIFDGSMSIHSFIKREKISPENIELCGCFRNVCILETWKGLRKLNYSVLPINKNITLKTTLDWRGECTYPEGYLLEDDMFRMEEDNKKQLEKEIGTSLPEEDEIVITKNGLVIIDEEGPLQAENLGTPIGDSILCGC